MVAVWVPPVASGPAWGTRCPGSLLVSVGQDELVLWGSRCLPWLLEGQGDLLLSDAASAEFWVLAMGL